MTTTHPVRVLIQERINVLTGKETLTTRHGDIGDISPSDRTPGEIPMPPAEVILLPGSFYDVVIEAQQRGTPPVYKGCSSTIQEGTPPVLTIRARNTTLTYDLHQAFWPTDQRPEDWWVGTLRP